LMKSIDNAMDRWWRNAVAGKVAGESSRAVDAAIRSEFAFRNVLVLLRVQTASSGWAGVTARVPARLNKQYCFVAYGRVTTCWFGTAVERRRANTGDFQRSIGSTAPSPAFAPPLNRTATCSGGRRSEATETLSEHCRPAMTELADAAHDVGNSSSLRPAFSPRRPATRRAVDMDTRTTRRG